MHPEWKYSYQISRQKWRPKYSSSHYLTSTACPPGTGSLVSFLGASSEHEKKAKGDHSAHHGALQLDTLLYTNYIRSDECTWILFPCWVSLRAKCLRLHFVALIADWNSDDNKEALLALENHATILVNSDEPLPSDFTEALHNFVLALKVGTSHQEFPLENM